MEKIYPNVQAVNKIVYLKKKGAMSKRQRHMAQKIVNSFWTAHENAGNCVDTTAFTKVAARQLSRADVLYKFGPAEESWQSSNTNEAKE